MKIVDLSKGKHSLAELLALAKSESVLIHSTSGESASFFNLSSISET